VRDPNRDDIRDVFAARTIQPLIRLGLVKRAEGTENRLVVSNRGRATWAAFLARGGQSCGSAAGGGKLRKRDVAEVGNLLTQQ
jgi:hypothetical protein